MKIDRAAASELVFRFETVLDDPSVARDLGITESMEPAIEELVDRLASVSGTATIDVPAPLRRVVKRELEVAYEILEDNAVDGTAAEKKEAKSLRASLRKAIESLSAMRENPRRSRRRRSRRSRRR